MQVDVSDPRFQGLFSSQDYALDPTDPQFAKTAGSAAIAAEAARRKAAAPASKPVTPAQPAAPAKPAAPESQMQGLLSSLKRKARQRPQGAPKWRKTG